MSNILEDDSITSSADMLSSSSTPFPPTSPQVAADPQQFINVDQLRSGMRSTLIPLVLWLLQDDISPSVVEAIMQIVAKIVKNDRHSTNLLCNSQLCTSDVISTGSHPVAASSLSAIDVLLTCGFAQEVTVNNYGILDVLCVVQSILSCNNPSWNKE
ncbi:uncharacterized protein MONOS_13800 [Monocercomonoides exilis]|uniref:uncharacterized protein n=1 Tax=Monocercomonoides exilis TaxID=2049356 RepID=UPI0035597F72|nr:hypothetical protein MONOS_13800 [Monocercomonoides exilis]|eukprot:MONOS_13800.1-p1 / transcript=MONOS_13800.1 / gene=MONOS_13800 / organism=Monocercomonoides_exilis_PA203 / gene_product=unspecified product / transcript_product=unspecified product / location=Mono_scaffold00885:18348-18818(-) / protein_length=157 / sequence_SO=supercontig / SO=protein_coding / is_pseudo=false